MDQQQAAMVLWAVGRMWNEEMGCDVDYEVLAAVVGAEVRC